MVHAALENKPEVVKMLLARKEGRSLSRERDFLGQTPFLKAVKCGNIKVIPEACFQQC